MTAEQDYGKIDLTEIFIIRACELDELKFVTTIKDRASDCISLPAGVWPIHYITFTFSRSVEDFYYSGLCDTVIIDSCGNRWIVIGYGMRSKCNDYRGGFKYSSYKYISNNIPEFKNTLSPVQIDEIKLFTQQSHVDLMKYLANIKNPDQNMVEILQQRIKELESLNNTDLLQDVIIKLNIQNRQLKERLQICHSTYPDYGKLDLDTVIITCIFKCDLKLPPMAQASNYISLPIGVHSIHSVVTSTFLHSLEDYDYGGVCNTMIIDSCGNMWVMMGIDESGKVSERMWNSTYSSYKFSICNMIELKTPLSPAQIDKIKSFTQRSHVIQYIEKLAY